MDKHHLDSNDIRKTLREGSNEIVLINPNSASSLLLSFELLETFETPLRAILILPRHYSVISDFLNQELLKIYELDSHPMTFYFGVIDNRSIAGEFNITIIYCEVKKSENYVGKECFLDKNDLLNHLQTFPNYLKKNKDEK